jgi:hypothetical protein
MSLISDVLSNQIYAHAFIGIRPGLVKASDPSEKFSLGPPGRESVWNQSDSIVKKMATGRKCL